MIYIPSLSVGPGLIYLAINDRSSRWANFGCACAAMIVFLKARTQLSDVTLMNAILRQQLVVPCHENKCQELGSRGLRQRYPTINMRVLSWLHNNVYQDKPR